MKKYDLFRSGDGIVRVLEIQDDRILVIDCIKHSMPVWIDVEERLSYHVYVYSRDEEMLKVVT